jgi:hypothetical protein
LDEVSFKQHVKREVWQQGKWFHLPGTNEHFCFSFSFNTATRLRSELKEKQWLNETENGEPGHQNTFAH